MQDETDGDTVTDKEHMFWGGATYADSDKTRVPRATYRCKVTSGQHACKKVTDHDGRHECLCGRKFKDKVPA